MVLELQNFELNLRNIYLYDEIDNVSALGVLKAINEIVIKDKELFENNINLIKQIYKHGDFESLNNKVNIPDINIYLNSVGGTCYSGFSLYDNIKNLNNTHCKTNIIASGCVMSMGVIILLSVPFEQRVCTKNTTFLIHQASGFSIGKTAEMEEQLKETKRLTDRCFDIISENTDISKKTLKENYDKKEDWFLTADDALKLKLISQII